MLIPARETGTLISDYHLFFGPSNLIHPSLKPTILTTTTPSCAPISSISNDPLSNLSLAPLISFFQSLIPTSFQGAGILWESVGPELQNFTSPTYLLNKLPSHPKLFSRPCAVVCLSSLSPSPEDGDLSSLLTFLSTHSVTPAHLSSRHLLGTSELSLPENK